jgi:pilus assembly protein CpaB
MNKRLAYVLLFALLVSGGASYIVYQLVSARITTNAEAKKAQVLAAARNLELGVLVKDTDLKTVDWTGEAPKGSLSKPEDIVGRGVISPIYEGEPILETRLAARGAGGGLAASIPVGMRAVAVRVNEVVGVSGFVVPGMRVDIIIGGNPPGGVMAAMGTITKTILQNIEVLSAGPNIQRDAEGKPVAVTVVNLLVTPEQAEVLSLVSNEMKIQLVLRNPLDKEVAKTPGTAASLIFSGQSGLPAPAVARLRPASLPVAPVKPPPPSLEKEKAKVAPPIIVEVFLGTRKTESKFQPAEKAEEKKAEEKQ